MYVLIVHFALIQTRLVLQKLLLIFYFITTVTGIIISMSFLYPVFHLAFGHFNKIEADFGNKCVFKFTQLTFANEIPFNGCVGVFLPIKLVINILQM